MTTEHKPVKFSKSIWQYRDVYLHYRPGRKAVSKWTYDVTDVVEPKLRESKKNRYEPFSFQARTMNEAMEQIDAMFADGTLVD